MNGVDRRTLIGAAAVVVMLIVAVVVIQSGDDGCGDLPPTISGEGVKWRATPSGPEVVVSAEEDFTVGALAWILRIGRLEFDRSYHPEGLLTELAFPIPAAAISLLEDGDGIEVRYGNPVGSGADGFGRADVDVDRTSGFATVQISDGC